MTIEERLAAVETELARLRETRRLETALEELRGVRQEGIEADLGDIKRRVLPNLAKALKELEEAATVTAYQQARLAEHNKTHAEWLAAHTQAIAEIRDLQRTTDERIEKLVAAIGDLLRRGNGRRK